MTKSNTKPTPEPAAEPAAAVTQPPQADAAHGQGGLYTVIDGRRTLVQQTQAATANPTATPPATI